MISIIRYIGNRQGGKILAYFTTDRSYLPMPEGAMNSHDLMLIPVNNSSDTITKEDEYSTIPLCIDDIISVCKEYAAVGHQIQRQIESIIELGVEEAIRCGSVKQQSLPHIKNFLHAVVINPYFGDASSQANDCLLAIKMFEKKNQLKILN